VIHGDDDQIVPIAAAAQRTVEIVKNTTLKVYRGAPHGLPTTHREQFNGDVLEFLQA
jgi:non-heme chloroperoxidase